MRGLFTRRRSRRTALLASLVLALAVPPAVLLSASPASAQTPPNGVSFTLLGCRLPDSNHDGIPDYTLPQPDGKFICNPESWNGSGSTGDYTSGNLGKSWNELDLVPYRVVVSAGNSAPNPSTFDFAIALDGTNAGKTGYDVISAPTLNPGSDSTCPEPSSSGQLTATPGLGGIDSSIYRLVTLTGVPKNTTCVYDYYGRLALGSHLFPGSSLHANLALPVGDGTLTTSGIGSKDVSIPVNEISPQELSKDMSATQGSDHVWNITKDATPAELNFSNTCDNTQPLTASVQVKVNWTRDPASPSGPVTAITHVYATNPANRSITVDVTDKIYSGTAQTNELDTASGTAQVAANTTQLVLTHTFVWNNPTDTQLNDVATASYTDTVTGIPVPGQTTASASATVQNTGPELNASAVINDVESISGTGLSYSVDSFSGATGAFDNGYVAGTNTTGQVSWTSDSQSDSGSVTFNKTVSVAKGTILAAGSLDDTATLTGSDGFTTSASASVAISVDTRAALTIDKTIPDVLQAGYQTFTFDVTNSSNAVVASVPLTFNAGDTEKTQTVGNLTPGIYTVAEEPAAGWNPQNPVTVDLSGATCTGTATFHNTVPPAHARVAKVTVPAGFESGWTFTLTGPGTDESATTTGTGYVAFNSDLGEGTYTITESPQNGWSSDGGSGDCTFTVDFPADADHLYSCTFTNTYNPSVSLKKTGSDLSKIGDPVNYTITLDNTSPTGGAAGTPSLVCDLSDPTVGFTKTVTIAAGAEDVSQITGFKIPAGAADPFPNTASASCHYPGLTDEVASATASHSVNLFQPSIKVTKTGPAYSKVGDTVTYSVTIQNTSSTDSPDLNLQSFSDSLVPSVTPPATCNTLAAGASCSFTYTYTVQAGDDTGLPGAQLTNTASATYSPTGFPNQITGQSSATLTLLHPAFTVSKVCSSTQPVPQAGPAKFAITITNTGDTDLVITADDGIGQINLAAGASQQSTVTANGPFGGQAAVNNTVNASATLASKYGLSNTLGPKSASASCQVGALANVIKTVSGGPVTQPPGSGFVFQLRSGASATSAGTTLATGEANSTNNGTIQFGVNLTPGATYNLCEVVMPGWMTTLGPPFYTVYNPSGDNSVVCTDFTAAAGTTKTFSIDNKPPPGGLARTIGFWKNWASCANSNGGQKPILDQTLAKSEPAGITIGILTLHGSTATPNVAPSCSAAVSILNKSDISTGKKMASDPLYNLAAQELAARLNVTAGAGVCPNAVTAINSAQTLLAKYSFNGTGSYGSKMTAADISLANSLATTLDNYNNNKLC